MTDEMMNIPDDVVAAALKVSEWLHQKGARKGESVVCGLTLAPTRAKPFFIVPRDHPMSDEDWGKAFPTCQIVRQETMPP